MKTKYLMMVLMALSASASLLLSSNAAQATEAGLVDSRNVPPHLTDVARDPNGSVRHMNQFDALSFCQSQGLRLPTARELALYAQSLGAQGVSDSPKEGYEIVYGSNPEGQPDQFFYSSDGYQRPVGDFGNIWFWSSSVSPTFANVAYILVGAYGNFYATGRALDNDGAVRCVK